MPPILPAVAEKQRDTSIGTLQGRIVEIALAFKCHVGRVELLKTLQAPTAGRSNMRLPVSGA